MITYEYVDLQNEAVLLLKDFSPHGLKKDQQAAESYSSIFLAEYQLALSSPHTTPESFLNAYMYRAMAVLAGASDDYLDCEAYALRQKWAGQ